MPDSIITRRSVCMYTFKRTCSQSEPRELQLRRKRSVILIETRRLDLRAQRTAPELGLSTTRCLVPLQTFGGGKRGIDAREDDSETHTQCGSPAQAWSQIVAHRELRTSIPPTSEPENALRDPTRSIFFFCSQPPLPVNEIIRKQWPGGLVCCYSAVLGGFL